MPKVAKSDRMTGIVRETFSVFFFEHGSPDWLVRTVPKTVQPFWLKPLWCESAGCGEPLRAGFWEVSGRCPCASVKEAWLII